MEFIGKYDLQSLQIYFNGSLEIQEELIRLGFQVPLITPIPIIYGDYGGYEIGVQPRGVLKPAAIHPKSYDKSIEEMGWIELPDRFQLPQEFAQLEFWLEKKITGYDLHLVPQFKEGVPGYHLEKASYRGTANQEKWRNWAMLYTSAEDLIRMVDDVADKIGFPKNLCASPMYIAHEKLGKAGVCEDTYFVNFDEEKEGIKQVRYNLCLGCFKLAVDYFKSESEKYQKMGLRKPDYQRAKLRIINSPNIPVFMKLGLAKVEEKKAQFMIKLATSSRATPRVIRGVGKGGKPITVKGKPRGDLIFCDHVNQKNEIVIDAYIFLRAACCARRLFFKMDGPFKDRYCGRCYITRLERAKWFPDRHSKNY
ncbi:hypothetical protein KEJ32_05120 [Candidatus Bathyarchaeota archaeon]|nr:hypothetical protein [Candidatus Bathyarchaeota archaeon]MBS7636848.1 hypothetical protein [Candidatus Bathyarchaeota archaeon]